MYQNWINVLLGLAVIAVAFMNLTESTLVWTLCIIGAVIAINSFWGMAVDYDTEQSNRLGRHS